MKRDPACRIDIVEMTDHREGPIIPNSVYLNGRQVRWVADDGITISDPTRHDAVRVTLELMPREVRIHHVPKRWRPLWRWFR